ncbi:unnamed protein product [Schistosoma mattheei]|uniref:Uncharacterized protein n=1 Tax=Schistosoma mattheei TaxID=31246 RepID=A0A183PCT0_9TREM|nr:unnamed protein product [Schistosoma mattheei]
MIFVILKHQVQMVIFMVVEYHAFVQNNIIVQFILYEINVFHKSMMMDVLSVMELNVNEEIIN